MTDNAIIVVRVQEGIIVSSVVANPTDRDISILQFDADNFDGKFVPEEVTTAATRRLQMSGAYGCVIENNRGVVEIVGLAGPVEVYKLDYDLLDDEDYVLERVAALETSAIPEPFRSQLLADWSEFASNL